MITVAASNSTLLSNSKTVFRTPLSSCSSQANVQTVSSSNIKFQKSELASTKKNLDSTANDYLSKTTYKLTSSTALHHSQNVEVVETVSISLPRSTIPLTTAKSTFTNVQPIVTMPWNQVLSRKQLRTPSSVENDFNTPITPASALERLSVVIKTTEAAEPMRMAEGSIPMRTTEAAEPMRITEAAEPMQTTEAATPMRTTEAATPMRTTEIATPDKRVKHTELSQMWVDRYRPKTCADVVGNDKAKTNLQLWFSGGHTKPCLIVGPTGIGKTCLAEALFKDRSLQVCDCRAVGINLVTVVTNLLFRKRTTGLSQVGLIVDEIQTLAADERIALGILLSKPFPAGAPAVICIVDSDVLPAQYSSVKAACYVITMYKPFETLQDAKSLVRKLQTITRIKLPLIQLQTLVELSLGDLRSVTIAMELLANTNSGRSVSSISTRPSTLKSSQPPTVLASRDLFLSPFEAARQLLRPSVVFKTADALVKADPMVPLFVFENGYANLLSSISDLETMAAFADSISLSENFDNHRSHQLKDVSLAVLASSVCVRFSQSSKQHKPQPVSFPAYLGKCSKQHANKRYLTDMRIRSYTIRKDAVNRYSAMSEHTRALNCTHVYELPERADSNCPCTSTGVTMSGSYEFIMNELSLLHAGLLVLNKEDVAFLIEYKKRFKF